MFIPSAILPLFMLFFTPYLRIPTVAADDPGLVEPQMDNLFSTLSGQPQTKIQARNKLTLRQLSRDLNEALKGEPTRELRIMFAEFAGTKGDVGKSTYYLTELNDEAVHQKAIKKEAGLWSEVLKAFGGRKTNQFFIKLVMDCRYENFLPAKVKLDWKADIQECGKTPQDFREAIKKQVAQFKPHVVILGHAFTNPYSPDNTKEDNFFQSLLEPIEVEERADRLVKINIKSLYKQPADAKSEKYKDRYKLTKNDIHLVGQTAEYFPALPSVSLQTRIGRAPTTGMAASPHELMAWVGHQKNIMYLGQGGRTRSVEGKKKNPTPLVKEFVEKQLAKPEVKKDWDVDEEHETAVDYDGKVFHLWYGSDLLHLWQTPQIKILMHHCGKGSFDDSVLAGKPQICIPQEGFADDMYDWTTQVNKFEIGIGLAATPETKKEQSIVFKGGSKASDEHYTGEQEPYPAPAFKVFEDAFEHMSKSPEVYHAKIEPRQKAQEAPTAGPLTVEVVKRMGLGLLLRHPVKKGSSSGGGGGNDRSPSRPGSGRGSRPPSPGQ
ncbi:MAG: hypothetical protein M1820_004351 [Bogoriella megaspora]|nr:MAG: hypothetical protein M1820_004351 [Bogoriella megaspora]